MKENNYAFIDSQNLNLSINSLGWKLDFKKFRIYLKDKYSVTKAFLFIGYVQGNQELYKRLQENGFILIFKPTLKYKNGKIKGNVDAEMVLQAMIEINNYDRAVLVTGDGDFQCLAKHLDNVDKLKKIIIPNQKSYSVLLKKMPSQYLAFVSDLKKRLDYRNSKKKRTQ